MENKIKILLVDDLRDFVETISFWMKSKGYSVYVCRSGEEALRSIKSESFDIIFMDIQMPNMNGVETLKKIREIDKKVPVILVTAYPENPIVSEANEYGISGVFPKEGSFERLTSVIEVALRSHRGLKPSDG
ncbi:MAG: response regulator [Candidatus Omnitrophica bacterium]|nr:response regulator [Candidatus Omnitrophota bacterium]